MLHSQLQLSHICIMLPLLLVQDLLQQQQQQVIIINWYDQAATIIIPQLTIGESVVAVQVWTAKLDCTHETINYFEKSRAVP